MENIKYWIWLSRIESLSTKNALDLLDKFNGIENLWNLKKEELKKEGISEKLSDILTNLEYKTNLDKYIEYMKKHNIDIITIKDMKYPTKLKNIYDPPVVIYIKGNKNILNEYSIAIVGCRECTKYGEEISKKFAYELGINNINVISGLARGIDACAHIGSLNAKGKTIAVIGSGLDIVYPKENKYLFDNIIKSGGAIISEYVIGTKPISRNFPKRNRIISGLSDGVIVVEARQKSGTLITVDFALEQGKEVYVVPGNINSINSYGTNDLIKQGAKIITQIEDIT